MTATTAACIRGCTMYRQHFAECEGDGCRGCLPRRAQHGHLCWPCHRRWELMLTDADTVDRWLTGNMTAGDSASRMKHDYERAGGGHEKGFPDGSPTPLKEQVYDQRQVLRDFYATTVDELCERENLTGPKSHQTGAADRADFRCPPPGDDAKFLLAWTSRVEYWPTIGDLWEYLAEHVSIAHALAPWRPELRRIKRVPCPGCAEVNLVIYGGESDITCLSCGIIMTEDRFQLWERVLREEAS